MAESYIGVTEAGTPDAKLRSFSRTVGVNTTEEEIHLLGEPYLATYSVTATGFTTATGGQTRVQLMAGASLNLRINRIQIYQRALGAADATQLFQIVRLTAAGSGGTAVTPAPFDSGDAAAGATCQYDMTTLPTSGTILHGDIAIGVRLNNPVLASDGWEWRAGDRHKPIIVPAGTSNGIGLWARNSIGTATFMATIEFSESNFT